MCPIEMCKLVHESSVEGYGLALLKVRKYMVLHERSKMKQFITGFRINVMNFRLW